MGAAVGDVLAVWQPPTLELDGVVYEGTAYPKLKEGIAFIRAIEEKASILQQLDAARAVLEACGFEAEVIDQLEMLAAIEAATRFFLAALQPPTGAQP